MNLIDYLEFSTEPNMYVLGRISTGMQDRYAILPESHVADVEALLIQKYPSREMYITNCFTQPNKEFAVHLIKSLISPDFIGQMELKEKQQTTMYNSAEIFGDVPMPEMVVGNKPMDEIGGHDNSGISGGMAPAVEESLGTEEFNILKEEVTELSNSNLQLIGEVQEKDAKIIELDLAIQEKDSLISQKENTIIILEERLKEKEEDVVSKVEHDTITKLCEELKQEVNELKEDKELLLTNLEISANAVKDLEDKLVALNKTYEEALKAKDKEIDPEEELVDSKDVNTLLQKLMALSPERCKKILVGLIYDGAVSSKTSPRELTSLCTMVYSKYYAHMELASDLNGGESNE